ncbi:hypothetical protein Y032_0017g3332 [Ancylostoma ceylanicum]|uniref:Uncharacterized protein n=1 Tax=Ancylostoma ceylanicum TaxID=53326 RepID=A0A016V6P6_9BILA|nr:hypothetical protein Y032_0017g3332 [Ancylostoma ceylanicum]
MLALVVCFSQQQRTQGPRRSRQLEPLCLSPGTPRAVPPLVYGRLEFTVTQTAPPTKWEDYRIFSIGCDNVTLEENFDYILGCTVENSDCKFVRRYDKLTEEEKKLLKI